jgi:hypothetical protein
MGLFDKVKKTTIEQRRYEEKLYEVALEEVEAGDRRKGLYSKALAKADGDTEKADGIYLKLRVQSIMDDIESEQIHQREISKDIQKLAIDVKPITKEECVKLLSSKGYRLTGTFLEYSVYKEEDYYTKGFGSSRNVVYKSRHLSEIFKWASSAKKVSTWE